MAYAGISGPSAQDAKEAYMQQTNAARYVKTEQASIPSSDPASLRLHIESLAQVAQRLAVQCSSLQDIADFILGVEPEQASARNSVPVPPVGGMTAEMFLAFQTVGIVLDEIEQQVRRLQRVSQ